MFYEYALEPAALHSWERVRFFLDAFGAEKGRFLAEYPRRWKKMVFQGLSCSDVEKKRIVERLSNLDRRIFLKRDTTRYDWTVPWLENALREHEHAPFRAIIAGHAEERGHVLSAADVDERKALWRTSAGCLVPRDPDVIANALSLLLVASKKVVIVDPYFRADQDDKTRPLVALAKTAPCKSISVHFSDCVRSYEQCIRDAGRVLPRILPSGVIVELRCWRELPGGPRLHNRYLLTEIGGVKFGDSIECGSEGHQDHISILDEPSREALWGQYTGTPAAFQQVGLPREFFGTRG